MIAVSFFPLFTPPRRREKIAPLLGHYEVSICVSFLGNLNAMRLGGDMKTAVFSISLLVAIAAMPAMSVAKESRLPGKALVAQQFNIWNAALKTGNAGKVAALYCEPGGILIPTLSNTIRSNRREIADYFAHFLQLKPIGRINTMFIRVLGPDTATDSGVYTFHLVKEGKPEDIRARYTFVYQKRHGKWCIMTQHSSAMPESEAHLMPRH